MTTLEILLSIVSTIAGSGLIITLVTIKQAKRKATTESEKGNFELVTESVNEMIRSVGALLTQNRELIQDIASRSDENHDLKKKIECLTRRVERMQKTIKDVLCVLEKLDVDESLINKLKEEIK